MDMSLLQSKKKQLEMLILGSIICDPSLSHTALQRLSLYCFSGNEREAYSLIGKLYEEGNMTDAMLMASFSQNGLCVEDYRKADFISDETALLFNCRRLMECHTALEVNSILQDAGRRAIETGNGLNEAEGLIRQLEGLLSMRDNFSPDKTLSELLPEFLSELEEEAMAPLENNTLRFKKLHHFNTTTNGLQLQNLIVISGAWKAGKTTLALEMALDLALNSACRVGFMSLEISQKELIQKILSAKLHVPLEHIRVPQMLTKSEREKLKGSREVLENAVIYPYSGSLDEEQIKFKMKSWVKNCGVMCIFIDYVNLINVKGKFRTREEEVSYISRMLKNLASGLNICIIALTQLNRTAVRERDSSAANLSESIALARDCNYLFSVSRPAEFGQEEIKYMGKSYPAEDIFDVQLCASRHSRQGVKFPLKLEDGELVELK